MSAGSVSIEKSVQADASLERKVDFLLQRDQEAQRAANELAERVATIERESPRRLHEAQERMEAHVSTELGAVLAEYRPARVIGTIALAIGLALATAANLLAVGDLDEQRRAIRVRRTVEKNERYRHLELANDLFAAIVATLPPREDRDLEAPLFPDFDGAALRTAITRACKVTGVPHFSPHGLRRRRGSLHYKRTGSLVQVAELLGDSERVARDHYAYGLTDYREVDREIALGPDGALIFDPAGGMLLPSPCRVGQVFRPSAPRWLAFSAPCCERKEALTQG